MKKSNIKQSIFTAENDLSKTQNTKEIVESMVVALNDHRIDDIGELGAKRIEKTLHSISTIDLAILVIADNVFGNFEEDLIKKFSYYKTPFFIIHNKSDEKKVDESLKNKLEEAYKTSVVDFSAIIPNNFDEVIELIKKTAPEASKVFKTIIGDLIQPNDVVMLICPIDSEAPAGRMILPQRAYNNRHESSAIILCQCA